MNDATDSLSEIQITLTNIWKEALKLEEIDSKADFLELGGDSLSAMLCIARMRVAFETDFLIEEFLTGEATIENMAALIYHTRSHFTTSRIVV